MSLTILNNISALTAENSMSNTQMGLQKTLTQLSTGMKINSGADDSAGLSIANSLNANIAALTQSQQNASNGVGMLQTADGALSQVTTLLNRAVTLATEGSSSNITNSQFTALNTEFTSILSEINQIGAATNFNGQNVFTSNAPTTFTSTQASLTTASTLTAGSVTSITDSKTGGVFVFTAQSGDTVNTLIAAVASAATSGTLAPGTTASIATGGFLQVGPNTGTTGITVTSTDAVLGPMVSSGGNNSNTVFISDGTTAVGSNTQIQTTINALSATALSLNANVLTSNASSTAALTAVNAAIASVSANRGTIGASVNRLTAASNVMSNQVQNLQSAANSILNADVGKTVANMTQFNILQSTGMAALQQANQAQQAVLKLLQ
ncbi:MAG TPA: flagellin [Acidisarcina sp.]